MTNRAPHTYMFIDHLDILSSKVPFQNKLVQNFYPFFCWVVRHSHIDCPQCLYDFWANL